MDFINAIVLVANFVIVPAMAYGSQLALGALGVTVIYAILRFSNFAHGETMSFGAMASILVMWALQSADISIAPLPTILLALPAGILVTVAMLMVVDRLVFRHYRKVKAPPVVLLIASTGVMFCLNGIIRFIIGPDDQRVADGARFVINVRDFKAMTGLDEGLAIKSSQLFSVGAGVLCVVVLFWFLNRTRAGKSMRAYSDNEDLALLSGVNPDRVVMYALDHRRGPRRRCRIAVRARQVVQAVHLSATAAADLCRGDRRRYRQSSRRDRRRLHHRVLRGHGDLRLQEVLRLCAARGLDA